MAATFFLFLYLFAVPSVTQLKVVFLGCLGRT